MDSVDWGVGLYSDTLTQPELAHRLLMYGTTDFNGDSVPYGKVEGIDASGATNMIEVGFDNMTTRKPKHDY